MGLLKNLPTIQHQRAKRYSIMSTVLIKVSRVEKWDSTPRCFAWHHALCRHFNRLNHELALTQIVRERKSLLCESQSLDISLYSIRKQSCKPYIQVVVNSNPFELFKAFRLEQVVKPIKLPKYPSTQYQKGPKSHFINASTIVKINILLCALFDQNETCI